MKKDKIRKLNSSPPTEILNGLDDLLEQLKNVLNFQRYNEETNQQIYRGFAVIYFFMLGNNIHKTGISMNRDGLLKHLQNFDLIEPKPRNYNELKATIKTLFVETSRYLENKFKQVS